ncbi:MAG: cyclic lactone autoinducer peptide [Bacilli bacterium]|nr:cyclic lactone autoinducer peptide [Bacilli bacterium]
MKKIFAVALTAIATMIGTVATSGCFIVLLDEPEMPDSLN